MKHLSIKVDANGTTEEVEVQQAVKATQDGNGNNISNTYVNLSSAQTITGAKIFQKDAQNSKPLIIQSGGVTTSIGDKNGAWTQIMTSATTNGFGFEGHINAMAGYSIYSADKGEVAYKSDFLNVLFPVGAYYITESATTPANLFGGEWVRVSEKFLFGANGNGDIGVEGGEWVHTLTEAEMPQHRHKPHQYVLLTSYGANSGNLQIIRTNSGKELANEFVQDRDQDRYDEFAGGGAAHNNMPPYRKVNIWRRTA